MHRHCAPFLFSKRSPSQTKSARKRCKAPCPRKRRYAGPPRQRPRARPRLRQASARLKTVRAALAAEAPLRKPAAPAPPVRVRAFVRHLRVSKQCEPPWPRKRRYASPPRQRPPGTSALSSGGKAASTAPLASAPSPGGCVSPKARKAALSAKLSRRTWQGPRRRDGAEAPARRISARRTCWSFRKSDFRGWPDKSDSRRRNCSNQSRSAQGCGRRCSCAGRFDT